MTDDSDLGIVLYLKGPSSADAGSYYDRKGTSRAAGALGTAYVAMGTNIDTAHPYVSAAASASMQRPATTRLSLPSGSMLRSGTLWM